MRPALRQALEALAVAMFPATGAAHALAAPHAAEGDGPPRCGCGAGAGRLQAPERRHDEGFDERTERRQAGADHAHGRFDAPPDGGVDGIP